MSTDSGHIVEHFRARRRGGPAPASFPTTPALRRPCPAPSPPAHPWIVMVVATTTNFGTGCYSHDKHNGRSGHQVERDRARSGGRAGGSGWAGESGQVPGRWSGQGLDRAGLGGTGQVEGVIDLIERNWTGNSTSATGPCGTPPLNCSASPDSSR